MSTTADDAARSEKAQAMRRGSSLDNEEFAQWLHDRHITPGSHSVETEFEKYLKWLEDTDNLNEYIKWMNAKGVTPGSDAQQAVNTAQRAKQQIGTYIDKLKDTVAEGADKLEGIKTEAQDRIHEYAEEIQRKGSAAMSGMRRQSTVERQDYLNWLDSKGVSAGHNQVETPLEEYLSWLESSAHLSEYNQWMQARGITPGHGYEHRVQSAHEAKDQLTHLVSYIQENVSEAKDSLSQLKDAASDKVNEYIEHLEQQPTESARQGMRRQSTIERQDYVNWLDSKGVSAGHSRVETPLEEYLDWLEDRAHLNEYITWMNEKGITPGSGVERSVKEGHEAKQDLLEYCLWLQEKGVADELTLNQLRAAGEDNVNEYIEHIQQTERPKTLQKQSTLDEYVAWLNLKGVSAGHDQVETHLDEYLVWLEDKAKLDEYNRWMKAKGVTPGHGCETAVKEAHDARSQLANFAEFAKEKGAELGEKVSQLKESADAKLNEYIEHLEHRGAVDKPSLQKQSTTELSEYVAWLESKGVSAGHDQVETHLDEYLVWLEDKAKLDEYNRWMQSRGVAPGAGAKAAVKRGHSVNNELQEYLQWLCDRGVSTPEGAERLKCCADASLHEYIEWLESKGVTSEEIKAKNLREYLDWLERKGVVESTSTTQNDRLDEYCRLLQAHDIAASRDEDSEEEESVVVKPQKLKFTPLDSSQIYDSATGGGVDDYKGITVQQQSVEQVILDEQKEKGYLEQATDKMEEVKEHLQEAVVDAQQSLNDSLRDFGETVKDTKEQALKQAHDYKESVEQSIERAEETAQYKASELSDKAKETFAAAQTSANAYVDEAKDAAKSVGHTAEQKFEEVKTKLQQSPDLGDTPRVVTPQAVKDAPNLPNIDATPTSSTPGSTDARASTLPRPPTQQVNPNVKKTQSLPHNMDDVAHRSQFSRIRERVRNACTIL